jgi:hypothetical protein
MAGFKRQGQYASPRRLHLFPPRHEVSPVRALHEDVGQKPGDQFARGLLIEQCHGIDSFERECEFRTLGFGDQGTRWPFHAPHASVVIQGEDQDVAKRPRLLQESYMAGMQKIIAAVGEDDGFVFLFPALALRDEGRAGVEASHEGIIAPVIACLRITANNLGATSRLDPRDATTALPIRRANEAGAPTARGTMPKHCRASPNNHRPTRIPDLAHNLPLHIAAREGRNARMHHFHNYRRIR